jgi:hypothetical protein
MKNFLLTGALLLSGWTLGSESLHLSFNPPPEGAKYELLLEFGIHGGSSQHACSRPNEIYPEGSQKNTATVVFESEVEVAPTVLMKGKLRGTQTGTLLFDASTGVLLKSDASQNMEGFFNVLGARWQVKTVIETTAPARRGERNPYPRKASPPESKPKPTGNRPCLRGASPLTFGHADAHWYFTRKRIAFAV